MDFIARQMARDIAFTLPLSKTTSHNPLKINFRCHICGDSAKDAYAKRGWFYEQKGEMWYGCFNCDYRKPFAAYLKDQNPEKYREYLLEKRKERGENIKPPKEETDLTKFTKVIRVIKQSVIEEHATRLDKLPQGHPALLYMQKRAIPQNKMCLFWFTMDWRGLANKVVPETYKTILPEPRIIIPIFDDKGGISAMQGRALRSTEKLRYITIKASDDANKIFGLERAKEDQPIFYLEGPIDSVFIDNALAIVGGVMALEDAPYKKTRAWVLDNEPRSKDTCKRIRKLIEAGERVVLWDKAPWPSKDVNDMILKDGASIDEINEYLKSNIVQGLSAKMRFGNWCKVKL